MKRLLILLLGLSVSFFAWADRSKIKDLKFEDLDGETHLMSEYIGQGVWVVLNVWGVQCPACVEEMPELQRFHDDFKNKKNGAMVLGFVLDFPSFEKPDKQQVIKFMENHVLDFPNLVGDGGLYEQFSAGALVGTPTTLIFTPEGQLFAKQLGQISYQMLADFIAEQNAKRDVKKSLKK